jgi:hypothetical protein
MYLTPYHRQLFFDDAHISDSQPLTRRFHQAEKEEILRCALLDFQETTCNEFSANAVLILTGQTL